MDRTSVRQGKEAWLQPSGELQDKATQDMTILKNWELYWSINWCWSAGRLSRRPSPFITLNHPILRCRDMAALQYCCNAAKSTLLHAAMLPGLHATLPGLSVTCYNTTRSALLHAATLRHGSTTGLYFCVVGSRPWHKPYDINYTIQIPSTYVKFLFMQLNKECYFPNKLLIIL
jgi:hypothetical protein